jgi:hypothetical protein
MADLPFLQPFVAPYEPVEPVSDGGLDLYRPAGEAPAVVLVHGGPVPAALPQRPPVWPGLADPPDWLAGVVLTYPMLDHHPDVPSRLPTPVEVAADVRTPVLLVRVEHEFDFVVPGQATFAAACPGVTVLDVPGAHHGFETIDDTDTDAARAAIADSVAWAAARARR